MCNEMKSIILDSYETSVIIQASHAMKESGKEAEQIKKENTERGREGETKAEKVEQWKKEQKMRRKTKMEGDVRFEMLI